MQKHVVRVNSDFHYFTNMSNWSSYHELIVCISPMQCQDFCAYNDRGHNQTIHSSLCPLRCPNCPRTFARADVVKKHMESEAKYRALEKLMDGV